MSIGKARNTVFAPPVGAASGMVMWKILPCRAVAAVILAHRAPLPFAEIWAPLLPGGRLARALRQSLLLAIHRIPSRGPDAEWNARVSWEVHQALAADSAR